MLEYSCDTTLYLDRLWEKCFYFGKNTFSSFGVLL
jgi:hypothetical protein